MIIRNKPTKNLAESLEMLTFAPSLKLHCKMKLFEFTQRFPDEASCESYLKAQREKYTTVSSRSSCKSTLMSSVTNSIAGTLETSCLTGL